jgi:tRNA dimethylallyltransferase
MAEAYSGLAVIVCGPTAVGKTDLCVQLAKEFTTDIISADARQFYREMNIGTAKPSEQEQGGVVHHLVDSLSVREEYNAVAFERDALRILAELFRTLPLAIITGGSGLYLKVLTDGLDDIPDVEPELREQLLDWLRREGLAPLLHRLDEADPVYAQSVDRSNPQRVIRALEVCLSTGKPYSSFRKNQKAERPFKVLKIGLAREREELYERINRRVDQMLAQGLVDEVRGLVPYRHYNALQTVGYTEVFAYLDGEYGYDEMVRLLKRNTRRYAKRQLTWFRRDPDIHWFHPDQYAEIATLIKAEIENSKWNI